MYFPDKKNKAHNVFKLHYELFILQFETRFALISCFYIKNSSQAFTTN